ncbi:hypothetical protein HRbin35_00551 [bacterium HR35]|nr:hypothetical protein HRbin35_00551 [bacterium HR35]
MILRIYKFLKVFIILSIVATVLVWLHWRFLMTEPIICKEKDIYYDEANNCFLIRPNPLFLYRAGYYHSRYEEYEKLREAANKTDAKIVTFFSPCVYKESKLNFLDVSLEGRVLRIETFGEGIEDVKVNNKILTKGQSLKSSDFFVINPWFVYRQEVKNLGLLPNCNNPTGEKKFVIIGKADYDYTPFKGIFILTSLIAGLIFVNKQLKKYGEFKGYKEEIKTFLGIYEFKALKFPALIIVAAALLYLLLFLLLLVFNKLPEIYPLYVMIPFILLIPFIYVFSIVDSMLNPPGAPENTWSFILAFIAGVLVEILIFYLLVSLISFIIKILKKD